MSSWIQERQRAIEAGQFETKQYAPPMETKPGIPHRAHKLNRTVNRAISAARKPGGTPVSPERRRKLERQLDDVIRRIQALGGSTPRKRGGRRSEPTRERREDSQMPASETYWAAWDMRTLCMELIGDLMPVPTPLVKWCSPEELARKYKGDRRTVGLCTKNGRQVIVELSNELSPRDAALVVAHELCHAAQFYGGVGRVSDAEREEVEKQARRFSVLAMERYVKRYGMPPKE